MKVIDKKDLEKEIGKELPTDLKDNEMVWIGGDEPLKSEMMKDLAALGIKVITEKDLNNDKAV